MNKFTISGLALLLAICYSFQACVEDENLTDNQEQKSELSDNEEDSNYTPWKTSDDYFAIGADISWLTEMEAKGIKFKFPSGEEGNCIDILKSQRISACRLRLWVNPANGYCSTRDVITKAKRAKEAGWDIMLDFHYSDTWADPGKQTVPAQWTGLDLGGLQEKVSEYTKATLKEFKDAGIDPKWVQVGNETGNGMLWPYGKADTNPKGYAALNNAGYDAVKDIFPDAKVIVHLQNGQDTELFKWLFNLLKTNGGKWDIIGMSLYPEPNNYESMVNSCKYTMIEMVNRYNCDIMLCEVGMGNSYMQQCKKFLTLCLGLKDEIPGGRFKGVFYWEPQVYNDWNGYKKGAFTSDGKPSDALNAFKENSSGISSVNAD